MLTVLAQHDDAAALSGWQTILIVRPTVLTDCPPDYKIKAVPGALEPSSNDLGGRDPRLAEEGLHHSEELGGPLDHRPMPACADQVQAAVRQQVHKQRRG